MPKGLTGVRAAMSNRHKYRELMCQTCLSLPALPWQQ